MQGIVNLHVIPHIALYKRIQAVPLPIQTLALVSTFWNRTQQDFGIIFQRDIGDGSESIMNSKHVFAPAKIIGPTKQDYPVVEWSARRGYFVCVGVLAAYVFRIELNGKVSNNLTSILRHSNLYLTRILKKENLKYGWTSRDYRVCMNISQKQICH